MKAELCCDSEWLISSEAYEIYKDCMYKPVYEKYLKHTRDFADDDDTYIFVCTDEKQKIGILVIKMLNGSDGEIIAIAVKPEQRRKGAGAFLVEKAVKMMNIKKLTAKTDSDTVLFYQSLGFECRKETVKYADGISERFSCEKIF